MKNTKTLQLFKAIKEAELREFTQFLKSPFYNRNRRVIALYEYLKKHKNNLDDTKFEKEYAFKRLFPKGEKYADWKMRELMSDLSKLIEEYFIVKEAQNNQLEREMLLIKSFEKRQIDDYFFKNAERFNEKIDDLKVKNMAHYLSKLELQHMLYYHRATSKFTDKGSRELLTDIMYNTDMFYSLAKLRYSQEISAWERIRGEHIEGFISKDVIENIPENILSDNLLIYIYQLSNKLFKLKKPVFYHEMKSVILKNVTLFSKKEATDLFTLLINSLRTILSDEEIFKEGFNLYKTGLHHELFMDGDYFMIEHFNNIVSIASGIGEYKWTQDFINQYYTFLPLQKDGKDNIAKLYTAHLNFLRKRYDDVEGLLYTMEFEDVSYGIRHYTLLIRSLYELKKSQVEDKCRAFKVYLHRKNKARFISADRHEGYNNFIKIVELLFNTWGKFKVDSGDIKAKMETMNKIELKNWLDEKIGEI